MENDSRLVVGLMSGTSADGVDAALCRITGHGTASKIEQLGFVFQPFSGEIRREILRLASGNSACAADFCKMNFLLGELYVQAVEALCAETGIRAEQIDLIGSHGQTFWHIPLPETYLGHSFRSTFQLGDGSVLAQRFGCDIYGMCLFATIFAATYAEIMARIRKYPVTSYLIVAIFTLMPGSGIYYTMRLGVEGNMQAALAKGLETAGIAGSIAVGILLVSTVSRLLRVWRGQKRARVRAGK